MPDARRDQKRIHTTARTCSPPREPHTIQSWIMTHWRGISFRYSFVHVQRLIQPSHPACIEPMHTCALYTAPRHVYNLRRSTCGGIKPAAGHKTAQGFHWPWSTSLDSLTGSIARIGTSGNVCRASIINVSASQSSCGLDINCLTRSRVPTTEPSVCPLNHHFANEHIYMWVHVRAIVRPGAFNTR